MGPTTRELAAAGEEIRRSDPERWSGWENAVDDALRAYLERIAGWSRRNNPPPPNISHLDLPLSYLAYRLVESHQSPPTRGISGHSARVPTPNDALVRCKTSLLYLRAVADSRDDEKLEVLLEWSRMPVEHEAAVRGSLPDHIRLAREWFVEVVDVEFGIDTLGEELKRGERATLESLAYQLVRRFAEELPADLRTRAYDAIHDTARRGPAEREEHEAWQTLFRLDPQRARDELVPFIDRSETHWESIALLQRYPAPSRKVAAAVRGVLESAPAWSRLDEDPSFEDALLAVLIRADPQAELTGYIARLRDVEARLDGDVRNSVGQADERRVDGLIRGLFGLDHELARRELRRVVFAPKLDHLTRLSALDHLGRVQDNQAPALLRQWLADRPQDWNTLRYYIDHNWGESGRPLIKEFDSHAR